VLVVGVLTGAGCARQPWQALPLGTAADFRDIWFADSNRGWIVGGSVEIPGGLVGRTVDGGRTWRFTSGLTRRDRMNVLAVRFFDGERGVVATDSGAMFATTDAGSNWSVVDTRSRDALTSVFFLDDRRGWAAGNAGVLATADGGRHWSSPSLAFDAGHRPSRAIQFLDERHGWLAGMDASLMRTADGGLTWEPAATPLAPAERPSFWDLTFVDAQYGWVVGEEGTILATTDGGLTWTRRHTGLADARSAPKLERIPRAGGIELIDAGDRTPGFTVSAVRFVDRQRGWVAGFYAGLGRSLILYTEDAGATWVVDADVPGEELHALFVQGREQVWAVGSRVRAGAQAIYRRSLVVN
jgi:photosystem II stability/assembly factor-like uncharacterized protein